MPPEKKKTGKRPPEPPRKPCPVCGKPATVAAAPFCSDRCRQVDLGHWLTGSYRIPARDDDIDEE